MNYLAEISKDVMTFYDDPLGYVMYAFPWDTDPSIQQVPLHEQYKERFDCEYGPDLWACQFLDNLGEEIRKRGFNGKDAVPPIKFSTSSGHGIGKSALVAWLIKFILDTRPDSQGVVTANTAEQLRTKTWKELSKWHNISLTKALWGFTSGRNTLSIFRKGEKADRWRCDGQTCREENSEAFQGLHAVNSTSFFIFDEASGIPDKIWEAREGASTDGEPMYFDFGNPTRKSGYFFENTVGQYKKSHITNSIDSRDVYITNKIQIAKWQDERGEDSDWFKVRVRGVFPSAGSVQFINSEWVNTAAQREIANVLNAPLFIGVDVARFGDNDTVIYPRVGDDARTFPPRIYNGLDTVAVADKVVECITYFERLGKKVSGLFIDADGIGGAVYDILHHRGFRPIAIHAQNQNFGESLYYRYRRDYMWGRMRDAIRDRLCIPDEDDEVGAQLHRDLTQREYGYTNLGKINLESKADMADRGLTSPDIADALALTFAQEIHATLYNTEDKKSPLITTFEYDPLVMTW